MKDATAAQGGMTVEELGAWVAQLREEQGLPPVVQEPTALSRIADLMRAPEMGGAP